MSLPQDTVGWSAVCDFGTFLSYSPTTFLDDSASLYTVKPVLSGHSKIDKTKVIKPCGSSKQVKSTTFDLH